MSSKLSARVLWVLLGGLLLCAPAFSQYQLNGWLAAHYENGKADSEFPKGTFGWAKGGLQFNGQVAGAISYGFEVQFKSESRVEIEEAWAGVGPPDSFQLKLGFYLVPFGRYNTANRPYQTPFIQTPLPQAYIYPESWRDIGLLAQGKWSSFGYSIYLGNGLAEGRNLPDGQQYKDNNGNKAVGGRGTLTLGEGFEIGGSYYRGKYDDASERNLVLYSGDLSWASQGFLLVYEYDRAEIDNPAGYAGGTAEGHFALASLNIRDFTVLASYQTLRYIDPYHEWEAADIVADAVGIDKDLNRWALGLTYSPFPQFAFSLEYDFNREKAVELDNDTFLAQVSIRF
jgi:hypothetical protein